MKSVSLRPYFYIVGAENPRLDFLNQIFSEKMENNFLSWVASFFAPPKDLQRLKLALQAPAELEDVVSWYYRKITYEGNAYVSVQARDLSYDKPSKRLSISGKLIGFSFFEDCDFKLELQVQKGTLHACLGLDLDLKTGWSVFKEEVVLEEFFSTGRLEIKDKGVFIFEPLVPKS